MSWSRFQSSFLPVSLADDLVGCRQYLVHASNVLLMRPVSKGALRVHLSVRPILFHKSKTVGHRNFKFSEKICSVVRQTLLFTDRKVTSQDHTWADCIFELTPHEYMTFTEAQCAVQLRAAKTTAHCESAYSRCNSRSIELKTRSCNELTRAPFWLRKCLGAQPQGISAINYFHCHWYKLQP